MVMVDNRGAAGAGEVAAPDAPVAVVAGALAAGVTYDGLKVAGAAGTTGAEVLAKGKGTLEAVTTDA